MILLVFEGNDAEPKIFDSIGKLFLPDEELCVVRCGFDLPTLYSRLKKYGEDLFRCLPLEKNGIVVPEGRRLDTFFSQIFLFFDYDFQNRIGLKRLNDILKEMLVFFSNETENGRLYINYPMVESLKYTKDLMDNQYFGYVATRQECVEHKFKENAEKFACPKAKGYRFVDLSKIDEATAISNWELLKLQNINKANYIITGNNEMPDNKDMVNQAKIFNAQISKYVEPNDQVAILNSFPIFVYDYLK